VISRNVDVGQTVAASFNTPTLFVIANDLSKMEIDALISEADIGGVTIGQRVNFTVDAYVYRTFHGDVKQVRFGPVTNQNVVNYDAVIGVNNDDLKLLPGMTANVSIIVAERNNVLKIPNAALRFRPPEVIAAAMKTNAAAMAAQAGARGPGGAGGGGAGGGGGGGGGGGAPGERGGGERGGPGQRSGGRGGGGAGFRGGGREGGGAGRADRPATRTVYILKAGSDSKHPELSPITIHTGINDGVNTEVVDGLKEGDQVVTTAIVQEADNGPQQSNPFGGGGGGRRRF
jgi:HlyD family secretion protein